jgi:hypothetical protein
MKSAAAWRRWRWRGFATAPCQVTPIIGARKLSQFQDNLASFELTLSADHLKTLDEASRIELGFPYDVFAKPIAQASCYGGLRDQILA